MQNSVDSQKFKVGLVGSGSIGVSWAIAFATAGNDVNLFDSDSQRLDAAATEIYARLGLLSSEGLGKEDPKEIFKRIQFFDEIAKAVSDSEYVQESVPEDLSIKQEVFADLDRITSPETILASSSSAIVCSRFAKDLPGRNRCLVVHPANPPYLLRVAELVPAPFTDASVVERASKILEFAGMTPVLVRREIEGFVFNRLQGALLREAYCLVRDGVVSANDLDDLVREGLGRRWAVLGPFATADLNVRGGLEKHAARMGESYARMGAERGQHDPWTPDLVKSVADEIHSELVADEWDENVVRRDLSLMILQRAILNDSRFGVGAS
jgi:L-gulonate 3-dehydrogenase